MLFLYIYKKNIQLYNGSVVKIGLLWKSEITINAKTSETTSSIRDIANHVKFLTFSSINSEKEKRYLWKSINIILIICRLSISNVGESDALCLLENRIVANSFTLRRWLETNNPNYKDIFFKSNLKVVIILKVSNLNIQMLDENATDPLYNGMHVIEKLFIKTLWKEVVSFRYQSVSTIFPMTW